MNIVITGASRGIGREVLRRFAEEPGHNIIAISRNFSTASGAPLFRSSVEEIRADLHDTDAIPALAAALMERMEEVHVLFNNAGMLVNRSFSELNLSDWLSIYRVNLFAPALLIRGLLPALERGRGHVVNTGSMGGFQGSVRYPGLSAYSSSKAALAGLTESLAAELTPMGISVNCLALGAVNTEMLAEAFPGYVANTEPEGISAFITEFCRTGHRYFNGKVLPVSVTTP
jgi:3-oxoacyl-[acyl-carrier protein] reductase